MNDSTKLASTPAPSGRYRCLGLIAGTALTAAATLLSIGAQAQAPAPQRPNILVIMGDSRLVQCRRLPPWYNVGEDAQPRQAGCAGNDVYWLLCRSQLHGRQGKLRHRRFRCARV